MWKGKQNQRGGETKGGGGGVQGECAYLQMNKINSLDFINMRKFESERLGCTHAKF